jgi:7-cyano-7-deazaguanine reductase
MKRKKSEIDDITLLGRKAIPSKKLEAFPNRARKRFYMVTLETDEFTCVCPITGQPDFAHIRVKYAPDKKVIESKSFKLYLWSYRHEGTFHEHVINKMLDDIVKIANPHWCKITGVFNVRGGIGITVEAEHIKTPEAKKAVLG